MDILQESGISGVLFFDTSGKGYLPEKGVYVPPSKDPFRKFLEIWLDGEVQQPLKFRGAEDKRRFLLWKNSRHNPEDHLKHGFGKDHERYARILSQKYEQQKRIGGHPLMNYAPKRVVDSLIRDYGLAVIVANSGNFTAYARNRQIPFTPAQSSRIQDVLSVDENETMGWAPSLGSPVVRGPAGAILFGQHLYTRKFSDEEKEKTPPLDPNAPVGAPKTGTVVPPPRGLAPGDQKQNPPVDFQTQADDALPAPPPPKTGRKPHEVFPMNFVKGNPGSRKIFPGAKIRITPDQLAPSDKNDLNRRFRKNNEG